MISSIRRRATYANVAVTLALVFAMSGGALAASRIIITSTSQIKKNVLTQIEQKAKGAAGAKGTAGATGSAGPQGVPGPAGTNGTNGLEGKEGSPWTVGGTLPSKASEHGAWAIRGEGGEGEQYTPISFPIPLKETLELKDVHFVEEQQIGPAKECESGTSANPKAAPGNLCIYEVREPHPGFLKAIYNPEVAKLSELEEGAGKSGVLLRFEGTSPETNVYGVWVVTQK